MKMYDRLYMNPMLLYVRVLGIMMFEDLGTIPYNTKGVKAQVQQGH